MTRGASIIAIQDVELAFGEKIVLSGLSLTIPAGEITCIIGLSGSGKSTTLRLINGLRMPQRGRVLVKGADLCKMSHRELIELRKSIGFAFQFAALFDSLTIGDNVAMPLRENTRMSEPEIQKTVRETLEMVGLADTLQRLPAELSGGMIKRAGFARAVVTKPEIVLFDEPTSGLDPIVTNVLTGTIKQINKALGATVVVVSHDMQSVYQMADRVALLFEGAIIAEGTVEEMRRSDNPIVQQFLQGRDQGPIPL
ncbi:MAG TPA: ABC transporter ATP-binding protein [Candidatus Dormibacteraeota bacterium]|nr:ABC transporter ATP-binding protein [Candidatus Dormibacteraeota bacterium]